MATIKVNGKTVTADESMTVLAVARREGIDIPTLCFHEGLGPYGACRLCVVEAESPQLRRSLVTSCTLAVSEGLSVETETPLVAASRRIIFELLLGRTPDSSRLREMAKRYGVETSRFRAAESDDCVRCGLCVRACRDKIGVAAISFAGRGQKRRVTAEFGKLSEACVGCGACANVCPTGAVRLEDKGGERTIFLKNNLIGRFPLVRCGNCGTPYATKQFLDHVASRNSEQPRTKQGGLCPECERAHYAEAIVAEFSAS
ncbi:MAG: 2Fe-2S iron-sulfur cluster-binding protein [Nitrospirota bacterium]|nr:2Fe-2S iron-sulfur cluster-binding protein [Nitrospirota bacterium]